MLKHTHRASAFETILRASWTLGRWCAPAADPSVTTALCKKAAQPTPEKRPTSTPAPSLKKQSQRKPLGWLFWKTKKAESCWSAAHPAAFGAACGAYRNWTQHTEPMNYKKLANATLGLTAKNPS